MKSGVDEQKGYIVADSKKSTGKSKSSKTITPKSVVRKDKYPAHTAWQRMFDPLNFNKARGAHYHTAPTVIAPNAMEYPEDMPKDSITIWFEIDETCWIGEPQKMDLDNPVFIEKEPQRGAKHAPVIILDAVSAYAAIPVKENYYWAAQVLSTHQVLRVQFRPHKPRTDGKTRKISITATFMPNDGEPRPT